MRGPKVLAVALLGFFASSLLAVQLMSQSGQPGAAPATWTAPAASPAPGAPAAPDPAPDALAGAPSAAAPGVPIAVHLAPAGTPDPEDGPGEASFPVALNLGVAPVPPVAASRERELALNDCVERRIRESDEAEPKQVLPGRWPALKRAREVKRLRRLQARAACEKEIAG